VRIGAIVITPPSYKASGGVTAAIQLMGKVAETTDTRMAIMADRDFETAESKLQISYLRSKNCLWRLRSLLPRAAITLMWRPNLRAWLRDWRPDIVHLHNPHPPGALRAAARLCDRAHVPYVISTHGFVEFDDYSTGFEMPWWQQPLVRMLVRAPVVAAARGAARVLMLSPFEEPILRRMGASPDRLCVVPNGVDPFFSQRVSDDERIRLIERFSLPHGRARLLFAGNHTVNKGLDVLLRAVTLLKIDVTVVVAGAIRSADENKRLLDDAGIRLPDPRVIFTDFTTKEELRALYQSADVFVFPSRADTLPLAVLEAMASGLPVVASSVGGIPFQVTDETGILIPPGDARALADAVGRLCVDRDARVRMGRAARARVLSRFDWRESARLAIDAYEQVLSARVARR
jgi:glycosyltransferase involved in cell wall biosynthesis